MVVAKMHNENMTTHTEREREREREREIQATKELLTHIYDGTLSWWQDRDIILPIWLKRIVWEING